MKLLGERNRYLPRWLQWLPVVDVEGGGRPHRPAPGHGVVPERAPA